MSQKELEFNEIRQLESSSPTKRRQRSQQNLLILKLSQAGLDDENSIISRISLASPTKRGRGGLMSNQEEDNMPIKLAHSLSGVKKKARNQFGEALPPPKKGQNLDQYFIDNPPIKNHGATLLTEFVLIGDANIAHDGKFLQQNQVTHILNTSSKLVSNIFDPLNINDKEVKQKLKESNQLQSKLIGFIKYKTYDWDEHKMEQIDDIDALKEIFVFIEEATQNYCSCVIVSNRNKCVSVVIGIIYLMMKFRWDLHRALEYINARKSDIEITKAILKHLTLIELDLQQELKLMNRGNKTVQLRNDWEVDQNINKIFEDEDVDENTLNRLGKQEVVSPSKFMRKRTKLGDSLFMGQTYIQVEDEASLINQYKNSIKIERNVQKKMSITKENIGKTMKELIAESIREAENKKAALIKQCDWSGMMQKIDFNAVEQRHLKFFNHQHFSKEKPKRVDFMMNRRVVRPPNINNYPQSPTKVMKRDLTDQELVGQRRQTTVIKQNTQFEKEKGNVEQQRQQRQSVIYNSGFQIKPTFRDDDLSSDSSNSSSIVSRRTSGGPQTPYPRGKTITQKQSSKVDLSNQAHREKLRKDLTQKIKEKDNQSNRDSRVTPENQKNQKNLGEVNTQKAQTNMDSRRQRPTRLIINKDQIKPGQVQPIPTEKKIPDVQSKIQDQSRNPSSIVIQPNGSISNSSYALSPSNRNRDKDNSNERSVSIDSNMSKAKIQFNKNSNTGKVSHMDSSTTGGTNNGPTSIKNNLVQKVPQQSTFKSLNSIVQQDSLQNSFSQQDTIQNSLSKQDTYNNYQSARQLKQLSSINDESPQIKKHLTGDTGMDRHVVKTKLSLNLIEEFTNDYDENETNKRQNDKVVPEYHNRTFDDQNKKYKNAQVKKQTSLNKPQDDVYSIQSGSDGSISVSLSSVPKVITRSDPPKAGLKLNLIKTGSLNNGATPLQNKDTYFSDTKNPNGSPDIQSIIRRAQKHSSTNRRDLSISSNENYGNGMFALQPEGIKGIKEINQLQKQSDDYTYRTNQSQIQAVAEQKRKRTSERDLPDDQIYTNRYVNNISKTQINSPTELKSPMKKLQLPESLSTNSLPALKMVNSVRTNYDSNSQMKVSNTQRSMDQRKAQSVMENKSYQKQETKRTKNQEARSMSVQRNEDKALKKPAGLSLPSINSGSQSNLQTQRASDIVTKQSQSVIQLAKQEQQSLISEKQMISRTARVQKQAINKNTLDSEKKQQNSGSNQGQVKIQIKNKGNIIINKNGPSKAESSNTKDKQATEPESPMKKRKLVVKQQDDEGTKKQSQSNSNQKKK